MNSFPRFRLLAVCFVSTIGLVSIASGAAPTLLWSAVNSSGTPPIGRGRAVGVMSNGDVISGTTVSTSPTSASTKRIVRHAAATGNVVWTRDYKDAASSEDINDMLVNPSTGDTYVCSRASRGTGAGELNWFVTKLNGADGTTAWTYEYDGTGVGSDNDECFAIAFTSDGNVVVVGQHNGSIDGRVAKINASTGSEMWAHTLSGPNTSIFVEYRSVAADSLGNVYALGTYDTGVVTNPNVLVSKFGPSSGTPLWTVQIDGPFAGQTDAGISIAVGPDNQPVVGTHGRQAAASALIDIFIYKLNATTGATTWTRQIGGTALLSDSLASIQVDASNNVYIAGALRMDVATPDRVAFAAKLNGSDGTVAWQSTKNGTAAVGTNSGDRYFNLQLANSSVYVSGIIANASSDLLASRFDAATGAELWSVIYDHSASSVDTISPSPHSLAVTGPDSFAMSAETGATSGLVLQFGAAAVNTAPTVTTATQTAVTHNSATLGGNVTADGGASVTDRGIVWSTSANPTTADTKVANGTGTGAFSATVNGLPSNTTVHVRAYATNSVSTSYGNDISFTTLPVVAIVSLNRTSATPSNLANLTWQITFDQAISTLQTSNFALVNSGLTGPSITSITNPNFPAASTTWNITVSTGTGDGTLGLNLANSTGLAVGVSTPLPYTGQSYTIDKTPPTVVSVTRLTPSGQNTNATTLTFRVTYSEPVTLTAPATSRFQVVPVNGSNIVGIVTGVTGSGATRDVTVNLTSGTGEFRLRVID